MEINIRGSTGCIKAPCWVIFPYRFGDHSTEFFAVTQEDNFDPAITHYFSGLRIARALQDEDGFLIDPDSVSSTRLEQLAVAQITRTVAEYGAVMVLRRLREAREEFADDPANDEDI